MLEREGIPVDCFCVDEHGKVNKTDVESGKPVLLLEEIASESSRFYLPAVHEIFLPQIENSLKSFGIENYLLPPKHILQMIDESSFLSRLEITPIIGCKVNCRFCPQNVLIKNIAQSAKKMPSWLWRITKNVSTIFRRKLSSISPVWRNLSCIPTLSK